MQRERDRETENGREEGRKREEEGGGEDCFQELVKSATATIQI